MLKILIFLLLFSCARTPLNNQLEATRAVEKDFTIKDELNKENLINGVKASIARLKQRNKILDFGSKKISSKDYIKALESLVTTYEKDPKAFDWDKYLSSNFDLYEVYGRKDWGDVLVTGYYTPVFKANAEKSNEFNAPLYEKPDDLVTIMVKDYRNTFERLDVMIEGRDVTSLKGRLNKYQKIVPYWTREDIAAGKINGSAKPLAWMDSVEAFFLQIQGSGKVVFNDGKEIYVHYGDQNGHPYHAIGKELLDVIPIEKMSMGSIKNHLYSLEPKERQKILNKDPSYVFFKSKDVKPQTYFGTTVVSERTIATDSYYYPKGVLAYLKVDDSNSLVSSRIVLDEDRGGAIKGGGRVDLYMGEGEEIGSVAGKLKQWAKLYYFVPKSL